MPGLGFSAGFADDDFVGWWILRPPNGPDQPRVAGEADLAYRPLRRHWRRGYASEGARELIRYGFEDVGLDRSFAQTMEVNAASRATMAAVGLTSTRAFVSGEPYDDLAPGAEQGEVELRGHKKDVAASLRVSQVRATDVRDEQRSPNRTSRGDLLPLAMSQAGLDHLRATRSGSALWLGHESIKTTYVYQHADHQLKQEAIDRTAPIGTPPGRYRPTDSLIAFLQAL